MAHSVSFKQGLWIEWKVRGIFGMNRLGTLQSQVFSFRGSTCQFLLQKGGNGFLQYIAISVTRENSNETPLDGITVKTFIEDRYKNLSFSSQNSDTYGHAKLWNYYVSSLREKEETVLRDGAVKFVFVFIDQSASEDRIETEVSTQTDVKDTPTSFECLSHDFQHLLDGNLLSDVTLKCGDRAIPAHRNILSARSDVFLAMLRSDMSESRTGVIEVSDMEPSTLDQLVQYIYSGEVSGLSADSAQQLYAAADKYAIESLKRLCGNFMKDNLNEKNAFSFLVLADSHGDKDLKDCALSFVANTDLLRDEEKWLGLLEAHPKLAAEVTYHAYKEKCLPK